MTFKTDFKDEIADRQYKIVDALTGDIIDKNVKIKRTDTPTQMGDEVGADWFNEAGKSINSLTDKNYTLIQSIDLDTIVETGHYDCLDCTNSPEGNIILDVSAFSGGYIVHIAQKPNSPNIYRRYRYPNSSFGSWTQLNPVVTTSLTYFNGWTTNGHLPTLTKIGNVVWLNAIVRGGITTVGAGILEVPEEYRPVSNVIVHAITEKGSSQLILGINGKLSVNTTTALVSNFNIQINAMWTSL